MVCVRGRGWWGQTVGVVGGQWVGVVGFRGGRGGGGQGLGVVGVRG